MSRRSRNFGALEKTSHEVIKNLFYNSQFSRTSHEKLLKQMKQEFVKTPLSEFFESFTQCLLNLFIIGEKHASVECALDFAAKFGVSLYNVQDTNESYSNGEEEEEMPPFLRKLFDFLFESHQTRNQAIRFRVCQFINKLLNSLGEEACLDDELCNKICSNMQERIQDKVPAVRAQAVVALQRLQDPTSPDCPVIQAFLFSLAADPSAAVRRSVLNCIGRTNITLPHILERTRDVKDTVRRHAYHVLTKLSIRSLTIKQRERLLSEGLKDRSELVSNFVATVLLPAWLRNMKGNYMDLLHALDIENSSETSELALKTLLKHRPLKEMLENITLKEPENVIPLDELTSENAFYWRCLAQHFRAKGSEELEEELEKILPDLTPFCQYIRRYYLSGSSVDVSGSWSQIQRQFVVRQLLELTKVYDLGDEMGRSSLKKLVYDMLTSTHVKEGLVPILVEILVAVDPNVDTRLLYLAEIVSEIREPMTQVSIELPAEEIRKRDIMKAKLRVQLNEVQEEQETAVSEKDFLRAQASLEKIQALQDELEKLNLEPTVVHQEVRGECNDRATLSKCLTIIYEMMQSPKITTLTPHLRSLLDNFVLHYIDDGDTYVRCLAVKAIGVFCLLDLELAKQYILVMYYQIANNDCSDICIIAIKVILDLFHLYGLQPFQPEEEEEGGGKEVDKSGKKKLFDATELEDTDEETDDVSSENVQSKTVCGKNGFMKILTDLLDSQSVDMHTVVAEGLCKLLLAKRIKCSYIVSRLLIMWYNPVTEPEIYLRQMLGEFFPVFATNCPWGQETLEEAILPTLRTLFQAPVTSPLVEVDQDSVVRLLINLTQPDRNQTGTQSNIHNNMAIALCNEALVDTDPYNVQVLLRALPQLHLAFDDAVAIHNIKMVAQKVADTVKDKTCLKYIQKFQLMLDEPERSVAVSDGTSRNLESVDSASVSRSSGRKTIDRGQTDNPEMIESDETDSDESVRVATPYPHSRSKLVIPETPDNSDSPISEKSAATSSSEIMQLDGEVQLRTPHTVPRRRSGRLIKRKSRP